MNQEKIGKLIKKLRKDNGLTQQDLADLLNLSPKTISKWEWRRHKLDYYL